MHRKQEMTSSTISDIVKHENGVEAEHPFDEIWEMYGKPVGDVEQLHQRWQELSLGEKKRIFEYVPLLRDFPYF